ncbi:serine/threonine/tyrosine-interacting-like protein 1 isoform X2 [Ambystoma mexicanum]|uniref:serine/threonine/tyrosine-interacting-like protein 1 isoform X2 n=1 Tax=Ambystoma mexicanum TaxID=8296 RepID=UPI0037E98D29
MAGIVMCEPREMYNILNQSNKFSRLAEPNYLCLLDCRTKREYNESHVVSAKFVDKGENDEYLLPKGVELECMKYCVVYDSNTNSLVDDTQPAIQCAQVLQEVSRLPIRILMGGYERFTALYHFFRTQKVLWLPREIDEFQPYPLEILAAGLYLGDVRQANDPNIQKDLKIKAQVNVTEEPGKLFPPGACHVFQIPVPDSCDVDIFTFFPDLCKFIGSLEPCPEMQKQHQTQPWLCETAVALGGTNPWHRHHGHLRPKLLGLVKISGK